MKSARQVERLVGRARLPANATTDERILGDAGAALAQITDNRPPVLPGGPTIWRMLMESKATRYSAAATIVIAAALVLSDPLGLFGSRHGVALAATVERMKEARTLRLKEKRVFYEMGKNEPMLRTDVVKYFSSDHGIVEEQYDEEGHLMARVYILKDPAQLILMLVEAKKYVELPLADSSARFLEHLTPKALVEHFQAGDCRDLGPTQVDGQEVQGFETNNVEIWPIPEQYRFLFPIKTIQWQFWVSKEQPLLVAADLEVTTGRGLLTAFKALRIACHDYDMEYDPNLPATLFDPNIPADYQSLNLDAVAGKSAAWLGMGALPTLGFIAYRRRHSKGRRVFRPDR
jgi:hypothetical protein